MQKTTPGSKSSKPAKKDTVILTPQSSASFLTQQAKEFFQKLKNAFCEEPVLQNLDVLTCIRLEKYASGITIGDVSY